MQHYIELFKSRMHVAGINPPSKIIADGRIHRFSTRPGFKIGQAGMSFIPMSCQVAASEIGAQVELAHGLRKLDYK